MMRCECHGLWWDVNVMVSVKMWMSWFMMRCECHGLWWDVNVMVYDEMWMSWFMMRCECHGLCWDENTMVYDEMWMSCFILRLLLCNGYRGLGWHRYYVTDMNKSLLCNICPELCLGFPVVHIRL
jgi:hypothetical protein